MRATAWGASGFEDEDDAAVGSALGGTVAEATESFAASLVETVTAELAGGGTIEAETTGGVCEVYAARARAIDFAAFETTGGELDEVETTGGELDEVETTAGWVEDVATSGAEVDEEAEEVEKEGRTESQPFPDKSGLTISTLDPGA